MNIKKIEDQLMFFLVVSFLLHAIPFYLIRNRNNSIDTGKYTLVQLVNIAKGERTAAVQLKQESFIHKEGVIAAKPVISINENAASAPLDEKNDEYNDQAQGGAYSDYVPAFRVAELPQFITRILPVYPPSEKQFGRQTEVLAEVYIDSEGSIRKVLILKSGGKAFDSAVREALGKSKFRPAVSLEGRLIPVRIRIPFKFELD